MTSIAGPPFHQSDNSRYDTIVVGAGIAGLSAAAHLAQAGQKVVVFEQHDKPGGLWTSFERNGVIFDVGGHWTTEADKINLILHGLDSKPVPFVPVPNLARFLGPRPGADIVLAMYRETFEHSILNSYPKARRASVNQLTELALLMERELNQYADRWPEERHNFGKQLRSYVFPSQLQKLTQLPAYRMLNQLFPGPELKPLRTALHMIVPSPSAPAIDLLMTIAMALTGRAFTPIGGAQRLSAAFAEALEINHGQIEYSSRVATIEADGREVTGVTLSDGRKLVTQAVISAVDARQTFSQLLNQQIVPRLHQYRLDHAHPSSSYILVSIVTDLNPGLLGFDHTDLYVLTSADIREVLQPDRPEDGSYQLTFPRFHTGSDNHLHGVQIIAPATLDFENRWRTGPRMAREEAYQELKQEHAMQMVARAETYLPSLRDHIVAMDVATPVTLHRYTLNEGGAALGWSDLNPWKQKVSFLKGLYQAGHWVSPPGAYHAAVSGRTAAELVLKDGVKK